MPNDSRELGASCVVVQGDDVDKVKINMELPSGEGTHFIKHFTSFMKWFTEHAGGEYEQHILTDEGRTH